MKKLLILTIIASTSCGKVLEEVRDVIVKESPKASAKFSSTDPTFVSYVNDFEATYRRERGGSINARRIPINFYDTGDAGFAGVCVQYRGGASEIYISESHWRVFSETRRRTLIFHELGHCALNFGHDDHRHKGIPTSYMNTYVLNDFYVNRHQDGYDNELMTKNKSEIMESIDYD